VYVTGWTYSTYFPTPGGFDTTYGGGGYADAFVTKVNANGQSLAWSSYLGGSGGDWGYGIAVDGSGNVYVTSGTSSTDFPTSGGFDATLGGGGDAFVVRIGPRLPNGGACVLASQCGSGYCVDGVCCDSACGGGLTTDCQACSVAAGAAVNGTCGFVPAGRTCRASAGPCDVAETCTGSSAACPADSFMPATTVCRASVGPCDVAETCTGTSAACPADGFASVTMVCRASVGPCDVAETCTGTSAACPPDGFASVTTVCRAAAGECDLPEFCDGATAACPPNILAPRGAVCRAAACVGDTAVKEASCTGASVDCPSEVTETCKPGTCNAGVCTTGGGKGGGCGCTSASPAASLVPWAFIALALVARRRRLSLRRDASAPPG
jgi:uncharacterized protein (TIGR03382 family)